MSETLFPYLVDSPDDGHAESIAWLHRDAAATAEEAATEFMRLYSHHREEERVARCSGLAHMIPALTVMSRDYEDVDRDELRGAEVYEFVRKHGHGEDDVRWEPCEPGDVGAEEWWKIELAWEPSG